MSKIYSLSKPPSNIDLLDDEEVLDRVFNHIDNGTTDLGNETWQEPTSHYYKQARFEAELELLKKLPVPFCPSAALSKNGSYIARKASGTPLLVVRGLDGVVRAFINACRHRGMQVASGDGCAKAFVCPYHAWTYNLEGKLKRIPGEEAFPGFDMTENGLVEISAKEKGGIIYVMQKGKIKDGMLDKCLDFFSSEQQLFQSGEIEEKANWKILIETLLEGYHIKSLHQKSFYPYGLDNTNLVETYGPNARVIFPFRRIEKLRSSDSKKQTINGSMTSVYHLYPNASVTVLSKHSNLTIMEPISPGHSKLVSYTLVNRQTDDIKISVEDAKRDSDFVSNFGLSEDLEAARAIQETVSSDANSHLTFGLFEKAIVNFHKHLAEDLK